MTRRDASSIWAQVIGSMIRSAGLLLLAVAAPALAHATSPDLSAARASQVGRWEGRLEYRDYQSNRWEGIPVRVEIRDGGDGVTQIRTADFDDGPKVGNVRITSVSMIGKDGKTEFSADFRDGREPGLTSATLSLTHATDATHWTIVSETRSTDDDRPARLRVTTNRDGANMVALKEVDFLDDAGESWVQRNRETLKRLN